MADKRRPSIKMDEVFKDEETQLSQELFGTDVKTGLINIPIERLVADPGQPRKTFYEQTLAELAASINSQGVLTPIIVRPHGEHYQIIAGERRFKAAAIAGLKEVPAIIKDVSDGDARIISLIENIQREDLNDIDRAAALRELKVNLSSSWENIAGKLGLTKRRILDLVGLLDLPDEIKEAIRQRNLTERHGRALRKLLGEADVLRDVFQFVKDKKLTGEQTQTLVDKVKGSEPRFTIEADYERLLSDFQPKPPKSADISEYLMSSIVRLSKFIGKINFDDIPPDKSKAIIDLFSDIKEKIEGLINQSKA